MLPREQPNLPRACCYYYFMWVQMILQAKKWAGSRKTIKSWWGRWKMPVPKSPSMLPVGEIETEEKEIDRERNRDREVDPQIKIWLHAWCLWGGFVFYDNGLYFNDDNLLGRNRNQNGWGNGWGNLWQQASQFGETGSKLKDWGQGMHCVQSGNAPASASFLGSHCSNRCPLAAYQDENHRDVYVFNESSYVLSREPGCWITSLKCLYTNAYSMGNKIELAT